MDPAKIIGANAHLAGLALLSARDGSARVALDRLELDHLAGEIGGLAYRADALVLDKIEARPGRGQITAEAVHLTGVTLSSTDGNMRVSFPHIGFPSGLQLTSEHELFAPHVSFEDGRVEIHDLAALGAGRGDTRGSTESDASGPRAEPDYRFFDALSGQLDIDLVVDLTLPWIGRRRGTHYFRIPIKDGTIDFAKLENDVHWLEGAFLTLGVIDDKLVLARDLPLVPYAGKALLQWRLEPADIPVARYQRVHLRNLLRWEVPQRPRDKGKSRVSLHTIALEKIRLHLSSSATAYLELRNGSIIQFGDEAQPGLVDLSASGELRHSAADPRAPTAIHGSVGLLDMTIKELLLGAAAVSADRLHIGDVERIDIGFEGFRPRRLAAQVGRLAATNLRVHLSS